MDTHIRVWWVHNDARLTDSIREHIRANEEKGLGVSVISCWEVAKLVEINKLSLVPKLQLGNAVPEAPASYY